MSDALRDQLRQRKIDARSTLEEFSANFAGGFALVTLFQVIEHLADPRALLNEIRGLLTADGLFAVSTVEGDEQFRRFRVTGMPDMPPNHLSIYNASSMTRMLDQCGFEVIEQRAEPPSTQKMLYAVQLRTLRHAREHPRSIAAAAQRVRHQRARHLLTAAAGLASLPKILANLGDARRSCNFLTIARRKRP